MTYAWDNDSTQNAHIKQMRHIRDLNTCWIIECKHGELFERKNVSEPQKISVSNGKEYCGHCGYLSEYARGYKKFYCIRCGGLNLRSWKN